MAVVSVTVVPPVDLRPLVRAAYSLGYRAAEFQAAVEAGRPVFEEELFGDREFHEVADEVEALVGALQRAGAGFVVREAGFEIALEVLANILAAGRDSIQPPLV